MKYIKIALLILVSNLVLGQNWQTNLPKNVNPQDLTLRDYQNAFYKYWEPYKVKNGYYLDASGQKKKAPGWKLFKRWEYFWEPRVDASTGKFPTTSASEEFLKWERGQHNRSVDGNWTALGPSSSNGGYEGLGRINVIAFHPTDNNTYWIGSPSGGIWKTTDDGSSWTVLSDNNTVLGVSDIAVSSNYDNDQTLYIATGDRDGGSVKSLGGGQFRDNNSIGVLKTTDGGITWNATGLSFAASQHRVIYRLLKDPTNNDILYAATDIGLYKTIDAGVTWNQLTPTIFGDLEFKPGSPSTIYASTRTGDIYKSIDSGISFNAVLNTSLTRVELAVSPNDSSIVYAIMANFSTFGGIYKSTDSGATFSLVYSSNLKNLLGYECDGSGNGGQGSYDLCMAVDPNDVNIVHIGGVNGWKSTDGGVTWQINTHWSDTCGGTASIIHADKHFLAYQNSSSTLFQCNDGGIYKTSDNGATWTDKTNGIILSQIYRISTAQTDATAVITGLQDNGSKLYTTNGAWEDIQGGDGMNCIINPTNYNNQYASLYNGYISRTSNAWIGTTNITQDYNYNWIHGIDNSEAGAWVSPYVIDPDHTDTLYLGLKEVWKTSNQGDMWTKVSNFNTGNTLRSLALAPSNNNVMYAATLTQLWKTSNGGTTWDERTNGLPVGSNSITYITIKNDDPNTLWVTFGNYDIHRVYQSTDGGLTWTNISAGLPNVPCMSLIQNKQNTAMNELYVATDVGVYVKEGNNNWQYYSNGLPNVLVTDLDIYYDNNVANSKIKAGTYGRGLWTSDLKNAPTGPMTYISSTCTQNNTNPVTPNDMNQEIIGIEIVIQGNQNPLNLTQFSLNTNGSSDAAGDITNARIYYSGISNSFNTNVLFGSNNNPNGAFTINGNQTLQEGTNYFWLAYDISNNATIGNTIDAECLSITINATNKNPTITAPAGSREIKCDACYSYGNITYETSITRLKFNTIDNLSGKDLDANNNAYSNFKNISTTLTKGNSYPLTLNLNTDGNFTIYSKVWIDWNGDCDFIDPGEEYDLGYSNNTSNGATSESPLDIVVPANAITGFIVLRASAKFNDYPTSCETNFDGEVEDYTLNIINACASNQIVTNNIDSGSNSLRNLISTTCAGDTLYISPTLSGMTLALTGGQIIIDKDITIINQGTTNYTIDAQLNSRIFHILNGFSLGLSGINLTHGKTQPNGGAIFNEGDLNLKNVGFDMNFDGGTPLPFTNKGTVTILSNGQVDIKN